MLGEENYASATVTFSSPLNSVLDWMMAETLAWLHFITSAPSSPIHIWLSISEMWSWPMESGMRAGRSLDDELGGVFNSKLANFMIPAVAKRHPLPSSARHCHVLCHHYLFSMFLKSFGLVLFLFTFLSKEILCHYRRQVSLAIRK